jgi:NH3-dependent NAD+ synthetase
MKTVKLHDIDMNVVSVDISNELVEHYKTHPEFTDTMTYEDLDIALQDFWDKFNELLLNQHPDFEDKFDMSELFEQLTQ